MHHTPSLNDVTSWTRNDPARTGQELRNILKINTTFACKQTCVIIKAKCKAML